MANKRTAAAPESPAAEPTLLYLMKQVELAVRDRLDDMVRPAGLTALQYTAMTVLERHAELTASRLAHRSFVTAQTMADMVTTLLERGYVERHRDPADRRRLVLALTPAGRAVLDDYRPRVAALEVDMLSPLSPAEASALRRAIIACRTALADSARAAKN
jgi:DNA-binding MarR family transcriptional regulator